MEAKAKATVAELVKLDTTVVDKYATRDFAELLKVIDSASCPTSGKAFTDLQDWIARRSMPALQAFWGLLNADQRKSLVWICFRVLDAEMAYNIWLECHAKPIQMAWREHEVEDMAKDWCDEWDMLRDARKKLADERTKWAGHAGAIHKELADRQRNIKVAEANAVFWCDQDRQHRQELRDLKARMAALETEYAQAAKIATAARALVGALAA